MKTILRYIYAIAAVLTIPESLWADVNVSNFAELQSALSGSETTINITADILNVTSVMTIGRDVTINGNGHTVSVTTPYLAGDGQLTTSPTNCGVFSISSDKVVTLQDIAPISSTGAAASGGTVTYFDYTTADASPFTVKMSYGDGGTTPLGGLTASTTQVTTNQDGSARTTSGDIPIGSSAVSSSSYYTVSRGAFEHGTMSGVSQYGDSYLSGTSVTVSAVPNSGAIFYGWKLNDGDIVSASSTFTFSVTQNTKVTPVFALEAWIVNTYSASAVYDGTEKRAEQVINITSSNCSDSHGVVYSNTHTSVISGQQYATNVGSYTAEVKNTCSDHPGTYTFSWEILPYNVTGNNITVTLADQTWTGNELTVTPTVQFTTGTPSTQTLTSGTDYRYYTIPETVKAPGEYTLVVEGMGNFTGSRNLTFYVKKNMDDAAVGYRIPLQLKTATDGAAYTMPATFSMEVKDGTNTLAEGADYTLTFSTDGGTNYYAWGNGSLSTDVGKYNVKVTGTGASYTGTKIMDYYVANEYQTVGSVTYHITEPAYSQPAGNGEAMIGAKTGAAIATAATTDAVQTQISTEQITVAIGGTDFTFDVTGIEAGAFKDCTALTTLNLPRTIASVGDRAFEGCKGLRWIDLNTAEGFVPTNFSRDEHQESPFRNLPRQTLVYLYGPTYSAENYVFRAGSTYTCDILKIYDDVNGDQTNFKPYHQADFKWAFQNEHNFTANTLINIRSFKAGRHYTVCLPYDIAVPTGAKAYTFEKAGTQLLGFKEVTGILERYHPYVLIPSVDGNLLNASNADVGELKAADEANAKTLNGVASTFYGTMRYMEGSDADGLYIMQYKADQPVWLKINGSYSNADVGPSVNGPTNPCILPMRAYINLPGSGARSYYGATFTDADGHTTAIDQLRVDEDTNSPVYDLQGRRVDSSLFTPRSSLRRSGLYINGGRKVFVGNER